MLLQIKALILVTHQFSIAAGIQRMSRKFKIGDEVQLKSGGPKMVVKAYEGHDVICVWFDQNVPHERAFHQDTLKKVST